MYVFNTGANKPDLIDKKVKIVYSFIVFEIHSLMVIQRWQTVFLFFATVLMVVFSLVPFATATMGNGSVELKPTDFPVYLILNILIALLLFIDIFLYRDLKRQRTVTLINIVLICASAVTGALIIYGPAQPAEVVDVQATANMLMLAGAFLFSIFALRGINKDRKTLSSYDRLR